MRLPAQLVVAVALVSCAPTDNSAERAQDVSVGSVARPTGPDSGPTDGTAENGLTCTRAGNGLAEEMSGVRRRPGECLVNYDGRPVDEASNHLTPEQAVTAAGFGRFPVTADPGAPAPDRLLRYVEKDGESLVGVYRLQRMSDGGLLVHSVTASTPY